MTRAWVGQGGGARFAQSLALVKRHLECGHSLPDFAVGTSAGALLMFCISRMGVDGTLEFMTSRVKRRSDLFGGNLLWGLFNSGVWNSGPLEKLATEIIGTHAETFPVYACYYDILNHKIGYRRIANTGDVDYLVASASIPVIVQTRNKFLVDGGVVENTPLKFAIQSGARTVDIFLASGPEEIVDKKRAMRFTKIEIALRCFEAMRREISVGDLKTCELVNLEGERDHVDACIHAPIKNYLDVLDFDKIRDAYDKTLSDVSFCMRVG